MPEEFTIGTDPEFFLTHRGKLISAIDIIPWPKSEPHELPHGGLLHHDNVALEVAVPYANSKDGFVRNVELALGDLNDFLPNGIDLLLSPSEIFPEELLNHPDAHEFGCSPDFNAYLSGKQNSKPPKEHTKKGIRTCGGHIHIGHPKAIADPIFIVQRLDGTVGLYDSLLPKDRVKYLRRMDLYGSPGCFRPTAYGVEYRTPTNQWLMNKQTIMDVYDLVEHALSASVIHTIGPIISRGLTLANKYDGVIYLKGNLMYSDVHFHNDVRFEYFNSLLYEDIYNRFRTDVITGGKNVKR